MSELQHFWYIFFGITIFGITISLITATHERLKFRKAIHNLRVDLAHINAKLNAILYKLGIGEIGGSYNLTSLTDNGTGNYDVTIAKEISDQNCPKESDVSQK